MKFKTFRMVMMGGLLALGVGGYFLFSGSEPEVDSEPALPVVQEARPADAAAPLTSGQANAPEANSAATNAAETNAAGANTASSSASLSNGLRSVDNAIFPMLGQPATSEKVKDAIPGAAKVSLYHDDKSGFYNRLKIDLNRNDKWDEKWTMKQGVVVKRQVAPADDENYTEEYVPEGGGWKQTK